MPRRALPSSHLLARLRAWFGLTRAELALYLGVSEALVQGVETATRRLTPAVRAALLPLQAQLPAPEELAAALAQAAAEATLPLDRPVAPPPPAVLLPLLPGSTPAPDAADLDFRHRAARAQAARLLREAAALAQRARVAERWAAALPALLAAHPDPDDPAHAPHYAALAAATPAAAPGAAPGAAPDPAELTRAREHGRWARGWLAFRARPLPPEAATRYLRLRAQVAGLLTEAAALAPTLPPAA